MHAVVVVEHHNMFTRIKRYCQFILVRIPVITLSSVEKMAASHGNDRLRVTDSIYNKLMISHCFTIFNYHIVYARVSTLPQKSSCAEMMFHSLSTISSPITLYRIMKFIQYISEWFCECISRPIHWSLSHR